ncbi:MULTISPECIES: glycosyltransferase family 2 protein [Brucella/Ochrobactrum group]|uniref:glycosyltransferase family 2 protein n=1 Tax=Brucella/Ochrobactrum group TaxID=2826938 RepID=UPI001B362DC5|nr:glycosyltransferase family 2 protein [Brucella anthropi]MBQ0709645.1 glycosyltransferase [Ochrobactrum sp. AP1BH01-1]UVV68213.1 glycosyltransferase family 2 protein [Brucella anthropi]
MKNFEDVAVIIPCYNEEITIGKVVSDAKNYLPGAGIFVYDNNSSDNTSIVAATAGANVRKELRQGKGYAIRRAFTDIDAEIFLMVDGDDTYDLSKAAEAIKQFKDDHLDFLNVRRIASVSDAYRRGHVLGNMVLTGAIGLIFGKQLHDMLSGYKILSRRFVKSFPISSSGFEIETELLVHGLELGIPATEISAPYKERPAGSISKLSTYKDGFRILLTIIRLVQIERPLLFFSSLSGLFLLICLFVGLPVVSDFFETGLVERLPSAVLAGFLGLISVILTGVGLTLDLVQRMRSDQKKLAFLAIPKK